MFMRTQITGSLCKSSGRQKKSNEKGRAFHVNSFGGVDYLVAGRKLLTRLSAAKISAATQTMDGPAGVSRI